MPCNLSILNCRHRNKTQSVPLKILFRKTLLKLASNPTKIPQYERPTQTAEWNVMLKNIK